MICLKNRLLRVGKMQHMDDFNREAGCSCKGRIEFLCLSFGTIKNQ